MIARGHSKLAGSTCYCTSGAVLSGSFISCAADRTLYRVPARGFVLLDSVEGRRRFSRLPADGEAVASSSIIRLRRHRDHLTNVSFRFHIAGYALRLFASAANRSILNPQSFTSTTLSTYPTRGRRISIRFSDVSPTRAWSRYGLNCSMISDGRGINKFYLR